MSNKVAPSPMKGAKGSEVRDGGMTKKEDIYGPDFMNHKWSKPDYDEARLKRKQGLLLKGSYPVCCGGKMNDPQLGLGVTIYFAFVRNMSLMFLAATILAAPALYLSFIGKSLSNWGYVGASLTLLTLANFGNSTVNANGDAVLPSTIEIWPNYWMDSKVISYIITGCSGVTVLMLLINIAVMKRRIKDSKEEVNKGSVTVTDYSVFVRGLPKDATHDEILEHFNSLYRLDSLSWESSGWCCGNIARHGPHDPAEVVDRGFIVSPRASVVLPHDNDARTPKKVVKVTKVLTPKNDNKLVKDWDAADIEAASPKGRRDKNMLEVNLVQITQSQPPVQDVSNTGNRTYKGKYIAEVEIAHPNGAKIRQYLKIVALTNQVREQRARVLMLKEKKGESHPSYAAAMKKLETLQITYETRIKLYESAGDDSVDKFCEAAFVIFDHEESYVRCLNDYSRYYGWLKRTLFQPKEMCFKKNGKCYPIQVRRAPEPDDITWENLEVPLTTRNIRRSATALFTLALMLGSFFAILYAKKQALVVRNLLPNMASCDTDVPYRVFGTKNKNIGSAIESSDLLLTKLKRNGATCVGYSDNDILKYGGRPNATNVCETQCVSVLDYNNTLCAPLNGIQFYNDNFAKITSFQVSPLPYNATCTEYQRASSNLVIDERINNVDFKSYAKLKSFGCYLRANTVKGCYCTAKLIDLYSRMGFLEATGKMYDEELEACSEWLGYTAAVSILLVFASGATVVINQLVGGLLLSLAEFERHDSKSAQAQAVMWKVFFARLINTAFLSLVINGGGEPCVENKEEQKCFFGMAIPVMVRNFGIFDGEFPSIDRGWFVSVGSATIIVLLLNIVVPHIGPLMAYFIISPFKRCCFRSFKITQDSLDDLYKGPKFNFETRYATFLNTIFCIMFYAPALPVLYVVGLLTFVVTYMVDKLLILRFYRKPTSFDENMVIEALQSLVWAVVGFLAVACWIYGADDLFYSIRGKDLEGKTIMQYTHVGTVLELYPSDDKGKNFAVDIMNDLVQRRWDPLEMLPRVVRWNTFPLFLILVLIIVLKLVWNIIGHVIVKILKLIFKILCCGQCGTSEKLSIEKEWNPQFTEVYKKPYDPTLPVMMEEENVQQGWVVQTEPAEVGGGVRQYVLKKRLEEEKSQLSRMDGSAQVSFLRTWEVIQQTYLATYDIMKNEEYSKALKARFEPIPTEAVTEDLKQEK